MNFACNKLLYRKVTLHHFLIRLLAKKEMMILKMLCMGLSNQEIADQAFCSITTVKTHVSHILYKTECKNRQQLISKYYPVAMKSLH